MHTAALREQVGIAELAHFERAIFRRNPEDPCNSDLREVMRFRQVGQIIPLEIGRHCAENLPRHRAGKIICIHRSVLLLPLFWCERIARKLCGALAFAAADAVSGGISDAFPVSDLAAEFLLNKRGIGHGHSSILKNLDWIIDTANDETRPEPRRSWPFWAELQNGRDARRRREGGILC